MGERTAAADVRWLESVLDGGVWAWLDAHLAERESHLAAVATSQTATDTEARDARMRLAEVRSMRSYPERMLGDAKRDLEEESP
jgi:hypothetical protein